MDGISAALTSAGSAGVASSVGVSVLSNVEHFAQVQVNELFSSLGLGQNVDTVA